MTGGISAAGHGELADVYEWLIGDDKLTPAQAASAYASGVVGDLPPRARVLDCACGTGQLAVGLAGLGLEVVAADASDGMVRRTEKLAGEQDVSLRALRASWEELPDHLEGAVHRRGTAPALCLRTGLTREWTGRMVSRALDVRCSQAPDDHESSTGAGSGEVVHNPCG